MKIMIVKTYFEKDSKDAERYLEYNNYGSVKNISGTDLYICILNSKEPNALVDVKIIDQYNVKSKLVE